MSKFANETCFEDLRNVSVAFEYEITDFPYILL